MNKSIKTLVIILLLILFMPMAKLSAQVSVWDGTHEPWTHGTGTEADPFLIENARQLAYLAYRVNNGLDAGGGHVSNPDYHYKLMIDVDLNGGENFQWTPIGYWNSDTDYQCFGGYFDGNNHTISRLYINSTANRIGFFGYMNGATIENLGVSGETIATTSQYVGGITGTADGACVITNCYNTGTVSSCTYSGGIVGYAAGTVNIINCFNKGAVSSSNYQGGSGGIVGYAYLANVTKCNNTGAVSSFGDTGGIAGYPITADISNCFNTGTVSSLSSSSIYCSGGIVGFAGSADITNCYNTGTVSSSSPSGGIVGHANGVDVINCYNTGTVSSSTSSGGIAGESNGSVTNSYYLNTCGGNNDYGGQSMSADAMQTQEFVDLLNNGTDVWIMDSYNVNQGYPIFSNMPYIRIITTDATNITNTHATLNGEAFSTETIISQGFEYRKTSETNFQSVNVSNSGEMSKILTGLTPGTQYIYHTFCVVDEFGTIYGNNRLFTTIAISVTTNNASEITQTHATLNGNINFGDASVTSQGFEYKKTSDSEYQTVVVSGSGNISTTLSDLMPNTQYRFRAFCTPQEGNSIYGQELTFSTLTINVITHPASNVTESSATLNGHINAGDAEVTNKGFKYWPTNEPQNVSTVNVSSTGNISATINNLAQNTYQYRAFAESDGNTYQGTIQQFVISWLNNDTIFVYDADKLHWVAEQCNSGFTFEGKCVKLMNDIELPFNVPNNMISIGSYPSYPFKGTFDGNGKHITNLYIDQPNTPYQGFFGYTLNANLYNVGLVNITASGRNYTGGMVAYAKNTHMRDCYVNGGTLYALSYCGGLVGYQEQGTNSIISGCYNTCEVTGNNYVGGLIGFSNYSTVRNSYVAGRVAAQGEPIGAIIGGANDVLMYYCYFSIELTGQTVAIGENNFKDGEGLTNEQMRDPEFVATLNQGFVTPVWKADYEIPINNGFPIIVWQEQDISGVEDGNADKSIISLYPNPANGNLTIEAENLKRITISNTLGQIIYSDKAEGNAFEYDFSNHNAGIYLIRIETESGVAVKKVLVER